MSRLDIPAAVNLAMQSKDLRLALLVSQSSGDQSIRTVLQDQMGEWDAAEWGQSADRDRVLAYLVLAGLLDDNRIPGAAQLSWFQGFALHLCFNGLRKGGDTGPWLCPSNGALELGLKSYERAFHDGQVRPPAVWYQQDAVATGAAEVESHDVRYLLLRLACNRKQPPITCITSRVSTDNPLNHAQPWHIYQALQAFGIWTPDSNSKNIDNNNDNDDDATTARPLLLSHTQAHWITANYAAQLEDAGMWHWAIYVALHLPENHRGEHAVRNILKRNCPSTTNMSLGSRTQWENRCRFLTEVIGIPRSAVHLAEVQRARYDRVHLAPDPWEFYQATNAKLWDSLHRNLLLHLLPQCLLQGEEHVLSSVLDVLGTETDVGRIAGWGSSGEVARMFLYLRKAVEELPHDQDEVTICQHLDGIEEVLGRITQKLAGDSGGIRLPPDTKEAHDVSGLRERSACILSVCEQQIVGNIAEYRWLVAEIRKSLGQRDAETIMMQETSPLGSLGLQLEAGSLTSALRRLVAKWLEWSL
jgi:nuclear pore complex protein Nup98-Nup96